jgi:hypothetical protein
MATKIKGCSELCFYNQGQLLPATDSCKYHVDGCCKHPGRWPTNGLCNSAETIVVIDETTYNELTQVLEYYTAAQQKIAELQREVEVQGDRIRVLEVERDAARKALEKVDEELKNGIEYHDAADNLDASRGDTRYLYGKMKAARAAIAAER